MTPPPSNCSYFGIKITLESTASTVRTFFTDVLQVHRPWQPVFGEYVFPVFADTFCSSLPREIYEQAWNSLSRYTSYKNKICGRGGAPPRHFIA